MTTEVTGRRGKGPGDIGLGLGGTGLDPDRIRQQLQDFLAEDLAYGPDITTAAVLPRDITVRAHVVARADGVIAGVPLAQLVIDLASRQLPGLRTPVVHARTTDGDRVTPGSVLMEITGPAQVVLLAERTCLNLLCQLSGVATLTRHWADALAPTGAVVRDTRKTVPGLRELQKYAVRCGGGANHRLGLGDAALIKDNHIAAAGSIAGAYQAVRDALGDRTEIVVEVECDTPDQVEAAVRAGASSILLDNMTPNQWRRSIALARSAAGGRRIWFEASGGLTLADAPTVAGTGIDFVAVGELTHSAPALDLGFDFASGGG